MDISVFSEFPEAEVNLPPATCLFTRFHSISWVACLFQILLLPGYGKHVGGMADYFAYLLLFHVSLANSLNYHVIVFLGQAWRLLPDHGDAAPSARQAVTAVPLGCGVPLACSVQAESDTARPAPIRPRQ